MNYVFVAVWPLIGFCIGFFGGPYIDAALDALMELLEPWWRKDKR